MRRPLRLIATLLALTALIWWVAAGRNTGWTKTSVEKRTLDEVTGIEQIEQERRFVPGIEFLGGIVGFGMVLFALSFCFSKSTKS